MGVPKTIDNDLMATDHTPGYGSAAKYIGVVMKEIIRDATVYGTKYVTVVEIMGRNAGWLTAAAALAKSDDCEGVDMICLPEVPFNVDRFVEKVQAMQETKPSIVIAVSEGVKLEDGRYVCELADDVHAVDAFGHKALTGTARYLANVIARKLDTKTRCIELATLQRCAGHLTSRTDITEAYQVGGAAAKAAFEGVTGQMVALKRLSNNPQPLPVHHRAAPHQRSSQPGEKGALELDEREPYPDDGGIFGLRPPADPGGADPAVHCRSAPSHLYEGEAVSMARAAALCVPPFVPLS